MIRTATKRTAGMDLDWEQDDVAGSWFAELPAIPGYPCYPYANDLYHSVQVADQSGLEGTNWAFYMYLNLKNEYVDLYNDDFGIPDTDTAEEMMDIVDNLSVQDIADVLQAKGYMPVDDVTASRKGKHMIRRTADEKTDTRIVENEDGTFTAYCEGDKKTFDDKGKAAEWLADHFNDEYHDKADARRAARRRMMMRAAARRAAMRRQAARRKAADDDRKDKGFDVSYDEDGKIHVRFDDGSDMDFDDMHDFADFVEGPDADEKPVDKEEAARARHAARVAMMRRRAARVASRPVARHAMRQDDGHPYL